MLCPEWTRLLDRYCALVQTYSEAVLDVRSSDPGELGQARAHADQLRTIAQQARHDWEEHERTHGCVRKPVAKVNESEYNRAKTGS